jgi:hypothetical protein
VAQPEQIIVQHKETQVVYTEYLGAQEAGKELLLYGVGDNALAPLKKQYINCGLTMGEDGNQDDHLPEV